MTKKYNRLKDAGTRTSQCTINTTSSFLPKLDFKKSKYVVMPPVLDSTEI